MARMEEHQGVKSKEHQKEETVTISKTSLWKGISGVLGLLLILSIFTGGFGLKNSPTPGVIGAPTPSREAPSPQIPSAGIANMKTLADDDPFLGKENAPVTIVEFSDFQCPFCERFYTQTLSQIENEYIKTGKVKLVYRDFPLGFHQYAQKAAEAAECADEQGKFWEFHNKIFENQQQLSSDNLKQWASKLGLDTNKFNGCLDSGKMTSEVQKDLKDGSAAGISGTPGFVINGKLISGAQPFSVFKQVIEAELS